VLLIEEKIDGEKMVVDTKLLEISEIRNLQDAEQARPEGKIQV
jgi:hypothetical protein